MLLLLTSFATMEGATMKTILIEWKSGLRQVHTDTADNLLDLLVMEIDHIEEVEYVEHIDKSKEQNNDVK